jgi:bis(5'-adenosyl)-triphosphatase
LERYLTAENCPFCKSRIGKVTFFSFEGNIALVNIAPVLPGHSLVIPEKHIKSLIDLTESEINLFFLAARKATKILLSAFGTDAFDWSLQEKPEAGQSVEHLHLHIVPRIRKDLKDPGDWYPLVQQNDKMIIDSLGRPRLSKSELEVIVGKLRETAAKTEV